MAQILIIDDEESLRYTFSSFLSKEGHDVSTAWDYLSAVDILGKTRPEVIFADIILPGGNTGLDILRLIRKKGLHSPVIMITGQPGIDTASEAVRQGAFDYVPKPIRRETLVRLTNAALKFHDLEEEKNRHQRHLEAIFQSVENVIVSVDSEMRIMAANAAINHLCGVSPETLVDQPLGSVTCQCLKNCHAQLLESLSSNRSIKDLRIECQRIGRSHQVVVANSAPLKDKNERFLGSVLVLRDITRINRLERELAERSRFHGIIGKSPKMQEIYNLLEDLTDTDTTVLITGESGTGKEMLADALHNSSTRSAGPLVKVNCSALAENLLESELFGHVKGAYTGAVKDRKGRFELADEGTLFLDEIGDIPQRLQVKLLRALQEKEIEKIGDATTLRVDVRVIAATNQDLKQKIKNGEFRKDLYYRLKVLEIHLPTLYERREDIPLLVNYFNGLLNKRFSKNIEGLSGDAMSLCLNYSWPGNVRELKHALEHAFILCHGRTLAPEHLPEEIRNHNSHQLTLPTNRLRVQTSEIIRDALSQAGWNKAKAARMLGISRMTLYRKLSEYNIKSPPKNL